MSSTAVAVTSWTLVPHGGGASSESLALAQVPSVVGRSQDCDIRLQHASVSQRHAEFYADGDLLGLRDAGSRNGTFVNGRSVLNGRTLTPGDILQFGECAFRLELRSSVTNLVAVTSQADNSGDLALAVAQVERLLRSQQISVFLQPIVSLQGRQVIAYESLARGRLFGVEKPETMFRAACFLHQEIELSELMRDRSLAVTMPDRHLFLNTHPNELKDLKRLLRSIVKLRQTNPDRPITMEVHEAAIADITTLQALRFALDDLQIGLAFDDFGAGQARIMELENVRPHCLKFDMQMIRGLDRATNSHIKMLRSLVTITRDLGICPLAEGIETDAEARACLDVGFALGQGFLFGHPEAALFR